MRRSCDRMRPASRLVPAVASLLLLLEPPSSLADCHGIDHHQWTGRFSAPPEQWGCDVSGPQRTECLLGPRGTRADQQSREHLSSLQLGCHDVYGPKRRDCLLGSSEAEREEDCLHQLSQVLYREQAAVYVRSILQLQEDTRANPHRMWEDPRESVSGTSCPFVKKYQMGNCLGKLLKPMKSTSDRTFKSIEDLVSSAWRNSTSQSSLLTEEGTFLNESTTWGDGYLKGFYFDIYNEMWLDIDECRENTSGCVHECENTIGSYRCKCRSGYFLQEDQKSCQDIDECSLNVSECAQVCENTDGSFRCKCEPGFSLMVDQKSCEDIDECRRNISGCTHACVNTIGSYKCKCKRGYFLMEDGKSCDDHDECAVDKNGRRYAPCTHICTNIANGFMCSCPEGFVINMRNPATCIDVRNVVAAPPGIGHKSHRQ